MSDTQKVAAPLELAVPEELDRTSGVVKWFNSQKGFGFITVEGCEDEIFVHQSNINTPGFRSLREGEEVEFDLAEAQDGKKKAFNVTGPGGAPVQGAPSPPSARSGFAGRGRGQYVSGRGQYEGGPYSPGAPYAMPQFPGRGGGGRGGAPAYWSPEAAAYFWGPAGPATAYFPQPGMPQMYAAGPGRGGGGSGIPGGGGGFFPGGRNWVGVGPSRPPPPGQPGISSGLQVVVHNLPWDCTWQQLKDAFSEIGEIDRADVVFDSRGRSRGFGVVRFATPEQAEEAAEKMNNSTIGGRVVSVRIDRFA